MTKCYRRCPRQFFYKYEMGLKPKRKGIHLERGDWLHQLLMVHYDGHRWVDRHIELTTKFNQLFEEEREELGDMPEETRRIMSSYLLHYAQEDRGWHVVDSELDEDITLPNGDKFRFIIDLIMEESDGGLWLWDHKTVTSFMPQDFMLIDAQLARYFWAAEKMGYKPLRGVLFNELRTKAPTIPEVLKSTGRLTERKNIDTDVYTYWKEIKKLGHDPKSYADTLRRLKAQTGTKWFRRTRLPKDAPLTKQQMREMLMTVREIRAAREHKHFPRNPMKSCAWDCAYLDPCMIELFGGDVSDVIKMRYDKRGEGDD